MSGCSNKRCDGHGWVTVKPEYADRHLPRPTEDVWEQMTAEQRNRLDESHEVQRRSLEEAVYPCQVCNETGFWQWRGGHWRSDHNRSTCRDCNPRAAISVGSTSSRSDIE